VVRRPRPSHLLGRGRRPGAEPAGLTTLAVLAAASAVTAAGFWAGSLGAVNAGGWLFVISAAAACLVGGAMVHERSFGRSIIPAGRWSKAAGIPGAKVTAPISYPSGMPGLKVGQ
jgi:hypothetical protein